LLNPVATEEVLDIYHASEFSRASWDQLQLVDKDPDIRARYLQHLLGALDIERIRACSFRVALDCSNGTAADVALPLLDALGCTVIPLNEDPGSDFAHPPAPTVKNMRQLASLLRYVPADVGAAINIDGDRVGFVTADGRALSEEYSFPLVAGHWLSRAPGPVVTNLSTSRMIDEVARAYGQPVLRTPIGEGYVVDKALAEHAAIAGEGSGGIAPLPASRTFDAVFSLAVVLDAMAVSGMTLQALAEQLPMRFMRKGTLSCPPDQMYRILEGFRDRYADNLLADTEGVLVDWGDLWMHIRASNTEPLLRIVVEGDKAQRADALFDELMAQSHQFAFGHALA
jgi:phosphomannomutase